MHITVLGKSPSWQDAGGACSGYLVEDGDTRVLLDCGSGVFSELRRVVDYVDVDAVVLSHMHPDHYLDLIPYACALTFAPRQQPDAADRPPGSRRPARPQLLVPPGASDLLRVLGGLGGQPQVFDTAFALREYDVAETLAVGSLRARFQPVPHYVPTNAIELTSHAGGGRFTYGADHGPTAVLGDFAAATDLLMLEATLALPDGEEPRGHLTAGEAGELAARCAAARLVLTHISDELDHEHALVAARRAYPGPVEIARTGAVYTV